MSAPSQQAGLEQGTFGLEISQQLENVGKAGQLSRMPREVVCCLGLEVLENR